MQCVCQMRGVLRERANETRDRWQLFQCLDKRGRGTTVSRRLLWEIPTTIIRIVVHLNRKGRASERDSRLNGQSKLNLPFHCIGRIVSPCRLVDDNSICPLPISSGCCSCRVALAVNGGLLPASVPAFFSLSLSALYLALTENSSSSFSGAAVSGREE